MTPKGSIDLYAVVNVADYKIPSSAMFFEFSLISEDKKEAVTK